MLRGDPQGFRGARRGEGGGRRWALAALAVLAASTGVAAQEEEQEPAPVAQDGAEPRNVVELAVGDDALWASYRNRLHRGDGYFSVGFLFNEDDDLALDARVMRFAEPDVERRVGLGIGLGVFGAAVDDTEDEVLAVQVIGSADYSFPTEYPVRVLAEISWAPDISTFAEGEEVFQLLARAEVDLSTWAIAFGGYRELEVELEDAGDHDLQDGLELGVRLGF